MAARSRYANADDGMDDSFDVVRSSQQSMKEAMERQARLMSSWQAPNVGAFAATVAGGRPRPDVPDLDGRPRNDLVGQSRYIKKSANVTAAGGEKYYPCRTLVYPPRDATLDPNGDEPVASLMLEHVHGYRGSDCQDNVRLLRGGACDYCGGTHSDGEFVYFVAAVGIVQNLTTGEQRFFLGHDDDIVSLAVHPCGTVCATGQVGKDPKICVWDARAMTVLATLQGDHERQIRCLSFSGMGQHLASIGYDDMHSAVVYTIPPTWRDVIDFDAASVLHSRKNAGGDVWACRFNAFRADHSQWVSCGERHIKFWDGVVGGNKAGVFGQAPVQTLLCLDFIDDGELATGSAAGDVHFWSTAKANITGRIAHAHTAPSGKAPLGTRVGVTAMRRCSHGLVTGGGDGWIKLWDLNKCALCKGSGLLPRRSDMPQDGPRGVCPACDGCRHAIVDDACAYIAAASLMQPGTNIACVSIDCACTHSGLLEAASEGAVGYGEAQEIDWISDCERIVIVGLNVNDILVVDLKQKTATAIVRGHAGPIEGLCTRGGGGDSFMTTSLDKTVRRWSITERSLLQYKDVWLEASAVASNVDNDYFAVGHECGRLTLWSQSSLVDAPCGPTVLKPPPSRRKVPPASEGCCLCWRVDCTSHKGLMMASASRKERISDIKCSPDSQGRFVAVSSHDNFIDVWDCQDAGGLAGARCDMLLPPGSGVRCATLSCTMAGHSSYVTHVDFSSDGELLRSTCGANELLHWAVPTGFAIPQASTLRDATWASQTVIFGWCVESIWPEGSDGTDVNALDASPDRTLLATADDNGLVKLFRFPCAGEAPWFRGYGGHSSHVANIRFTPSGRHVISIGGADGAVMQWRVVGGDRKPQGHDALTGTGDAAPTANADQQGAESASVGNAAVGANDGDDWSGDPTFNDKLDELADTLATLTPERRNKIDTQLAMVVDKIEHARDLSDVMPELQGIGGILTDIARRVNGLLPK